MCWLLSPSRNQIRKSVGFVNHLLPSRFCGLPSYFRPALLAELGSPRLSSQPPEFRSGRRQRYWVNLILDLTRRDLHDLDGRADHVGWPLLAFWSLWHTRLHRCIALSIPAGRPFREDKMKAIDAQARLEYARAAVAVLRALRVMDKTMRYREL